MKKILSLILLVCMAVTALSGCNNTSSTATKTPSPTVTGTAAPGTTAVTPVEFGIIKDEMCVFEVENYKLSVTVNDNVKWTTSNPEVVSVDQNGIIKGIKKGTAVITAENAEGKKALLTILVSRF